jgi:hypothetical protein
VSGGLFGEEGPQFLLQQVRAAFGDGQAVFQP